MTMATCRARCCSPSRWGAATCWRVQAAPHTLGLLRTHECHARRRADGQGELRLHSGVVGAQHARAQLAGKPARRPSTGAPSSASFSYAPTVVTALAAQGLELYRCGSLLGYSLLPIVLFSAAAVFLPARHVRACCLRAELPLSRARRWAHVRSPGAPPQRTCRGFTACMLGALATTWSTHTASSLLAAIVPSLEARCLPACVAVAV